MQPDLSDHPWFMTQGSPVYSYSTDLFYSIFSGVMNAADYYGLDELKQACSAFIESCITVDTVCALLATAERYIQYKCTKVLVQKVGGVSLYSHILKCI